MVILIGGPGCTGKTVLAQRLLEKYRIPYLSVDHLKMGLIRGSRYCDFTAEDPDDEIAAKLWPILKGIIMTNVENGQHLILEGCYLLPEQINDLEPEYLGQTIALWFCFTDRYIANHFESGILGHRCEIEHRGEDDGYITRQRLRGMHSQLRERCAKQYANCFVIDGDYEHEIGKVVEWIDRQVAGKLPLKVGET